MSKQAAIDSVTYPLFGGLTSIGIGAFIFEFAGALFLGMAGALGGWIIKEFVIPKLNKIFKRNETRTK